MRSYDQKLGVAFALGAAALFGASTPVAKVLGGAVHPLLLAGILYLGSGAGLGVWLLIRPSSASGEASLRRQDVPWLAGATVSGGAVGPALLMYGSLSLPLHIVTAPESRRGIHRRRRVGSVPGALPHQDAAAWRSSRGGASFVMTGLPDGSGPPGRLLVLRMLRRGLDNTSHGASLAQTRFRSPVSRLAAGQPNTLLAFRAGTAFLPSN